MDQNTLMNSGNNHSYTGLSKNRPGVSFYSSRNELFLQPFQAPILMPTSTFMYI